MKLTVCVLLYGDYLPLARRCLSSITTVFSPQQLDLRIGMNAVSRATQDWVQEHITDATIWRSEKNIHKYPMMRRMLYDKPVTTDYVMWFDDDSYLTAPEGWRQRLFTNITGADLVGSPAVIPWQGAQKQWVQRQSWYARKSLDRKHIRFITGGWWVARVAMLQQFNYPWPELDHRGGDTMLGELCFQQDLIVRTFIDGVRINAALGGGSGTSPRRGYDSQPLGYTS